MRSSAILVSLLWICSSAHAWSDPVGEVLHVEGKWQVASAAKPLILGASVSAGDLVTADPNEGQGSINIVLVNGAQLSASCSTIPCRASVRVPSAGLPADDKFQHILSAVMYALFNQGPKVSAAFEATSSRGLNGARQERVMAYSAGTPLSLDTLFSQLPHATYTVQLTALGSSETIYRAELRPQATSGLSPKMPDVGLYMVTAVNRMSGQIAGDVLLDIVPPSSYAKIKQDYDASYANCSKWSGPDAPAAAHLFLRALLVAEATRP